MAATRRDPFAVRHARLIEEGSHTAVYPYAQLSEIQEPTDCREALLDETQNLEEEFGRATVQPLYDLIWTINCSCGVFTSHTAVASRQQPSPYNWAAHYVAVAIIMLSRDREDHTKRDACGTAVNELGRLLTVAPPQRSCTGWYLSVGPCHVIYTPDMDLTTFRAVLPTDTRGYGTQLIIGAAANNRATAARRWHDALTFVNDRIRSTQIGEGIRPASPHQHAIPGALPTHSITQEQTPAA